MQISFLKKATSILFFTCILFNYLPATSAIITSKKITGNWSSPASWVGGVVPTSSDDVEIVNGARIAIDIAIANSKSLILKTGSSPTILSISGNNTLTITGNLTIQDGDPTNTLAVNAGTLTVGGNVTIQGNGNKTGSLTVTTGVVNVLGNFGFESGGQGNDGSKIVEVTNSGSILIAGTIINAGSGTIDPATSAAMFEKPSFKSVGSGDWNTPGNWLISSNSRTYVQSGVAPIGIAQKIEISSGQIVTGMPPLEISSSTVFDLNGSLDCGTNQITGGGIFNLNAGATLITSHASGIGSGGAISTAIKNFSSAANYEFKGAMTGVFTTFPAASTVQNLTIDNATGVNLSSSLTVNGSLCLTSGAFNIAANKLILNGSTCKTTGFFQSSLAGEVSYNSSGVSQSILDGTYGKITLSNSGIKTAVAGNINILGDWTSTGGKIDLLANSPTINFNGTNQTISDGGSDSGSGIYFKKITFSNSGNKSIASGKFSVHPTGILTVAGSSILNIAPLSDLILKSDASGNANVASLTSLSSTIPTIPANRVIQGTVKVESYYTGSPTGSTNLNLANRGRRMVSAPIDDATTSKTVYQQIKDYVFVTGPGNTANGFDLGNASQPNAETITIYNETYPASRSGFDQLPNITTKGVIGKGFFLYFRGSRDNSASGTSMKLVPPYTNPDNVAITFTGPLNQGYITVPVTNTGNPGDDFNGHNVVGNPFASTIDWKKVFSDNSANLEDIVSFIKPDGSGTVTYSNGITSNKSPQDSSGAASSSKVEFIQPGQAFYVKVKDGRGGNMIFKESQKVADYLTDQPARLLKNSTEPQLLMSADPVQSDIMDDIKILRINLEDSKNINETVIVFNEGSEATYGLKDAIFISGGPLTLVSFSSDKKPMAINFMPEIKDVNELQLGFFASSIGPFKLNFTGFSNFDGFSVFLKDSMVPDTLFNVKTNSSYSFSIDRSNSVSTGLNRFKLFFEKDRDAVVLKDFTAQIAESWVSLDWETTSEFKNEYFDLERSADGDLFMKIGRVKAAGTSLDSKRYSYVDKSPRVGMNYYRLKQTPFDSRISYSKTASVYFGTLTKNQNADIIIYPNPVIDYVHILAKREYSSILIKVIDATGKTVRTEIIRNIASNELHKLDISSLRTGVYIIECSENKSNKNVHQFKILKN